MESFMSKISHGIVNERENFLLVANVKEDQRGPFNDAVKVNSENKHYILCSCQLKDSPNDTILYLSNDPNDFVPQEVATIKNNGVVHCKVDNDKLKIDIRKSINSRTINFPKTTKFQYEIENKNSDINFISKHNKINFPLNRLQYGIPYDITYADGDRINFHVRKNVPTGRIGPSIATFSEASTSFEYLKTEFFAAKGSSSQFTFESDFNILGISALPLETNSVNFNNLPISNNCGIISLQQGSNFCYNVFNNPLGVSDIYLKKDADETFLNTETFDPDTGLSLAIQVNIRNSINDFVTLDDLSTTPDAKIFDFYLHNLGGFISSGKENNSQQYFDENYEIKGGIKYYPDPFYTPYKYFLSKKNKGFLHILNTLNNTHIDIVVPTNKKTSLHAETYSVFSQYYDAINGINLNKYNSYDPEVKSGKKRNIVNFMKPATTLHQNSQNNLSDPNKPVFTDNKHYNEKNFLIPIILMSIFLLSYIIFAYYYSTLTVE